MVLHLIQGVMVAFVGLFSIIMGRDCYKNRASFSKKNPFILGTVSLITMFFDTLGIGSVPPRTAFYKIGKIMPDNLIPGTLMIHDVIPCVIAAFIFMLTIDVELLTLVTMVVAAALGATLGARFVTKLPLQKIQMILGVALILVALIISAQQMNLMPPGGDAIGLHGWKLAVAVGGSCISGFLLNIGIPYYPTTMAVTYMLGMSPRAIFPVMVTGCVMLMGAAGFHYIKKGAYDRKVCLIGAIAGSVGVAIAAFLVKEMPLYWLKWIVVVVLIYTSALMIRSSLKSHNAPKTVPTDA
ncbi:MAG: sulfite exporter TauE/SafE family protein [Bacillota bacterium]|nr:sulfite exporter TauE/SafE family protein [Bacillota bacterium]